MNQSTVQVVSIGSIIVSEQVRKHFDPEAHVQLTESLKRNGLLQPIIVRVNDATEGVYNLIAGERRLRAAKEAGWTEIEAKIMGRDTPITVQLVENIQRENLKLEETAAAINALYNAEGNQSRVAEIVGKSVPWVSKMLAVHNKLGKYAAELLALEATTDIELLGVMSRIEELENAWPRIETLAEQIKRKEAGRAEARELLDVLQQELTDKDGEGEGDGNGEGDEPDNGYNWTALDTIHMTIKTQVAMALASWKPYIEPTGRASRAELEKLVTDTARAYVGHIMNDIKVAADLLAREDAGQQKPRMDLPPVQPKAKKAKKEAAK